jgi:hypothetical protein
MRREGTHKEGANKEASEYLSDLEPNLHFF